MAVSVFGNRRPLRSILPSTSTQQVAKEVRTENELRQALQPLDTSSLASLVANTGRRIIITAPITLKAPIIIEASLPGTVIESNGYLPITCGTDGIDAFEVRAPLCTLSGLLFYHDTTTSPNRFRYAISVGSSGANGVRITDCHCMGAQTFISNRLVGSPSDWRVSGCVIATTGVVAGPGIDTGGINWSIESCSLQGSAGDVAVLIAGGGGACAIVGNDMANDGITTSASGGLNFIVGNTRAGALTTHGTDIVLQAAGGGGVTDGVYGDITVTGGGTIWTVTSGGGGTFGQATATFSGGADAVTVTVVDAGVSAGSNIIPSVGTAAGRDADEMEMAPIVVSVASITAGVGFTLLVVSLDGDADGAYLINYTRD